VYLYLYQTRQWTSREPTQRLSKAVNARGLPKTIVEQSKYLRYNIYGSRSRCHRSQNPTSVTAKAKWCVNTKKEYCANRMKHPSVVFIACRTDRQAIMPRQNEDNHHYQQWLLIATEDHLLTNEIDARSFFGGLLHPIPYPIRYTLRSTHSSLHYHRQSQPPAFVDAGCRPAYPVPHYRDLGKSHSIQT
jgi:hypothetical protein